MIPVLSWMPPALYAMGRGTQSDLVHTTPDYAIFAVRRNIPLVITFHNYVLDGFMQPDSSPFQRLHYATDLKWFARLALRRARVVTAVSQFIAQLVKSELNYSQDIRVIYNGTDAPRHSQPKSIYWRNRPDCAKKWANIIARKRRCSLPSTVWRANIRLCSTRHALE